MNDTHFIFRTCSNLYRNYLSWIARAVIFLEMYDAENLFQSIFPERVSFFIAKKDNCIIRHDFYKLYEFDLIWIIRKHV